MRAALSLVLALFAATAAAHPRSEHGSVTTVYPDPAATGVFSLIEDVAPGTIPNGLFYYTLDDGVSAGDTFQLMADEGNEPLLAFCSLLVPAETPRPNLDDSAEELAEKIQANLDSDDSLCSPKHPDFDIRFSGGHYENAWGDEEGTVPGSGGAFVYLFFGDAGEGFTYSES